MRITTTHLAVAIAAAMAMQVCTDAYAQSLDFSVPAQPASTGVRQFAQQAGIQVIVSASDAEGRHVNPVEGEQDTRLALNELVKGTGLVVRSFDNGVAVLGAQEAAGQGTRAGEADTLDTVVVTGSRIARPDLVNPMPVAVVDVEEGMRFGDNQLYDILRTIPAIGVGNSLASSVTGWDAGATFINLRNLGTNRSLTLVDGKRRVSSSARSSAVDIGTIPLGMIDRVEVVTGGAAAVYGADAVTGAVNIITKKEIDETTVSISAGLSERGDAGTGMASVSSGFTFADGRGRVAIGGTYTKTDPLYMYDRYHWTWQPFNLANPANTGASDGIPDNLTLYNYRQHYYAYEPNFWLGTVNGQAVNTRYMLTDSGNVRPMYHDVYYSSGIAQFATGNGGDGRNLTDHYQFRGGNEAISVLGRTEFDFSDKLRWAGWFDYTKSDYDGDFYPYRDDTRATFMGVGSAQAYLDNPFLPDSIRAVMQEYGLTSLNIDRTYGNFPVRDERHHRKTFTVGTELFGGITDYIGWSAFLQYGKVEDDAVEGDIPRKSRWLAARDVVALNGQPVCRDEAARAAGCVPLNIFSTDAPSKALLDYVLDDRNEYRVNTQLLAGAEVNGSLWQLPAGNLQFALGLEYRKDTLENVDDPLALSGELVYGGGPGVRSQLDVETSVKEVFGELVIPVFSDVTFARRLDVELAYRYSDYSTVGGTDAWKAGLIWDPFDGFAVRGVKSRSVRTPNFGELYEPIGISYTGSISDPCMVSGFYANPTRTNNCMALGVAEPGITDPKVGPVVTTGGNPELGPETSDSLTVGFVWQPSFLENFDLTMDYWDIEIQDVIAQLSYTQILNLCVDLPSIDNPYCAATTRNTNDQVVNPVVGIVLPLGAAESVKGQQANISRLYARGVDLAINYRVDVGPGRLGLRFAGTRLIEEMLETTPGVAQGNQQRRGAYANPEYRASLITSYDIDDLSVAVKTRYHGKGLGNVNATEEQYDDNTVPSRTYVDLSARYLFGTSGHAVGLSISNVFDRFPPQMGFGEPGIYANSSVYDLVGRAYSLNWTYKF